MKVIAIALMLFCFAVGFEAGENHTKKKSFEAGAKHALYHRPVSNELEMVCAGLWMAEQHKIAYERGLHE